MTRQEEKLLGSCFLDFPGRPYSAELVNIFLTDFSFDLFYDTLQKIDAFYITTYLVRGLVLCFIARLNTISG